MISCNLCAYFYSGEWDIWSKCVNTKHSVYFITLIRMRTCTVQNVGTYIWCFLFIDHDMCFIDQASLVTPNVFCFTCITLCYMSDWDYPLRCNPSTLFFSVDLKKKMVGTKSILAKGGEWEHIPTANYAYVCVFVWEVTFLFWPIVTEQGRGKKLVGKKTAWPG